MRLRLNAGALPRPFHAAAGTGRHRPSESVVTLKLLVAIACAILFYRAAYHERMSPWLWAFASMGLSLIVSQLAAGILWMLLAQVGLFVAMWAYNAQRPPRA